MIPPGWESIVGLLNRFTNTGSGGPVRQIGLSYRPARLGIDSWAPLRDSVTRFSTSGFFHESVSPKPLSIPLGSFRNCSKIRGDIRSLRFATGVNDTGGKCKKSPIIKVLIYLVWTPLGSIVNL